MKVLICLFAVLAVANAGFLASNGLYGSGVVSTGSYISAPVLHVQSAPTLQAVHLVKQPVYQTVSSTVYSAPAPIYHTAPIYRSSPIISTPLVSVPVVSTSYGINYGSRYASTYPIGGATNVISVVKSGFLKSKK